MWRTNFKLFTMYVVIGFFLFPGITRGESLSVEEAIALAYQNNPELNALRAGLDKKKAEYWRYWGLSSPEIYFMEEGIRESDNSGYLEKQIGISQNIDFPLTSYFRLRRNNYEEQSLEKNITVKMMLIRGDVKKVYARLVHAQATYQIGLKEIESAIQLKNAVATRLAVGQSSEMDLLKAEIEYANIKNKLNQMERDFHTFRYGLFELIGMKPGEQKYSVSFPDSLVFIDFVLDQTSMMKRVSEQPEHQQAILAVNSGEQGINASWSSLLPNIRLQYYQQDILGMYDTYGYEIGLTIPLWFWTEPQSEIREAYARKNELFWQKEQVKQKLKKEIELAWHNYDISKKSILLFKNQIRDKSKRLFDMTFVAYQSGSIDLLSFLDTQRRHYQDQRAYLELLKDYYFRLIDLEKFLPEEIVFVNGGEQK